MSYSFRIADGDLVALGNQLSLVFGVDKLRQDIDLWLRERYGGDRFHVTMGSVLPDFIGDVMSGSTRAEIHGEVLRVLQNYQAVQLRRLHENPQLLSTSELLVSVDDIATGVSFDTAQATIKLRNGSNTATTIKVATSL
jgi:phage baseplate assembly protein W